MLKRKRGGDFKKSRMRVPIGDEIANRRQATGDRILGNHFAIRTNTFAKGDKVRGCEQTGAISLCAQDRIDHGTNRAFAIRPGDVDNFPKSGAFQAVGDLEIALP